MDAVDSRPRKYVTVLSVVRVDSRQMTFGKLKFRCGDMSHTFSCFQHRNQALW